MFPGSSDEDEPARESFTTPGFDRLNSQNFEGFGEDVRDIDQIRKETEEEWKKVPYNHIWRSLLVSECNFKDLIVEQ